MAKAFAPLATAINIRPADSRFTDYLNEATMRLLLRGKFWDTCGRFAVTVDSQILTPPPYVDTVEAINVEKMPLPLRSRWYEFLDNGWGTRDDTLPNGSGISECILRGTSPTFRAMTASSILTVKCDLVSDVGKSVRIMGYDTNNNWVRTEVLGVWTDGEAVLLAQGAGTATTTTFSRVTDVQPPTNLNGKWWLYQGTVATGTLIGQYEYWESSPNYKQYLIPFVNPTITTVELMGKLAYRPVVNDTDYLIIGNLPALKLGMMACKAEQEHNWGEAQFLWEGGTMKDGTRRIGAVQLLDQELQHHTGDGTQIGINLVGPSAGFGEVVEPLV